MNGNKYQKKWWLPFIVVLIFCVTLCAVVAWFCVPTFKGSAEARRANGNICVALQKVVDSDEQVANNTMTVTVEKLVGPWHLAEGENDDTVVNETFPGAMEFGNSMEITSDGNISWYIGADGGSGSYVLNGNTLSADIISDIDGTAKNMEFTVREKDGQLLLTMVYKNLTLCWSWGETETGKGE